MFALTPFGRRLGVNYDPFREFDEMRKSFFGATSLAEFKTDIRQEGDNYILEADLPGFRKEDIKIDVEGDYMTIHAERKQECKKEERDNYIRSERSYGSFSRTFDLSGVDGERVSAAYQDGVLTLTMPKKETLLPKARQIEIQ